MPRGGRLVRSLDRPGLVALGLGLVGIGYRAVLVLLTVPGSNSDEATFGLAALHIAQGRELPIFLYGQHYMGTVQSYLAAPLFALLGPSWVALRAPLLVLYAAFVYLTYRLTRRLYSPWLATCTVGLLALGGDRVVRDQITAVGGRPEIKPAVLGLLLIALALGQRRVRHRWLALGLFGVIAGLCVWDDWLVLPYLAAALGVLLVGGWRELFRPAGALLVGGFLLGVAPLILDNLTAPPGQDSISVLRQVSAGDATDTTGADRLRGAVLIGIPLATGACPPDGCRPWQLWWGGAYLALLLAAAVLAGRGLRRRDPADAARRDQRIRYATQLALVVAAALTVAAYARSSLAATAPLASARYLSILQISLPAVLWPLWLLARATARSGARVLARVGGVLAAAVLTGLTALLVGSTAQLIGEIGTIRTEERQIRTLARTLERSGVRAVYAEYWTCNRLVFVARERITCAVLGDTLRPGQDRYRPYVEKVRADPRPAYVFEIGASADAAFRAHLRRQSVTAAEVRIGDHRIYLPDRTIRPPR